MKRWFVVPLLTIILVFSCFKKSEGLKEADLPMLINQFLMMHVQYHSLDDELSERILNTYINILDYGKYYFYKEDVEKFQVYRHKIDDNINSGQYGFIYEIFSVYKKRFKENMIIFNELLNQKYDFNRDESILVDAEKTDYARNRDEMKEKWRKNIKLQLLNYMSVTKDIEKAKEKLRKKYSLIQKRVEEINEDKILASFVNAFSMSLDPHSNFLTWDEHQDFKISMELKLEGIGVRLSTEDGFVTVESIIPGGAADKLPRDSQLKPRDKIISVAQGGDEAVDVIDMDLRDVVKKIRGKKGTEVRLTVLRKAGDSERDKTSRLVIPITREEIKLQDSEVKSEVFTVDGGKGMKIGYIKLPSFYSDQETGKSSALDMMKNLQRMINANVEVVILDLRGNPGGLLNEAVDIAGLFIHSGPIVEIKDGMNPPNVLYNSDSRTMYEGPLVVLIDKFSASASEILAGAFKDYKRGIVLGPTNTFGKGTVQSYHALPQEKGAIKITTHIFYQPEGNSNQLYGISPDIKIPDMTSIWDIGEDKAKHPLKWKKIKSAEYQPYNRVNQQIVSALAGKSSARVGESAEFRKLNEKIEKFKKQLSNKIISLKEESIIEKQKEKEIEKSMKRERGEKLIDLQNDLFLKESFNITKDYLKLLGR
ncbi:MAG: carboxy terminal-processing peptidase [Spirochaetes bacterium]|jgi:carboxyl-terminal processing protease|nr:carboxy terminal-processing peptidase [Spirochaetota bacterium]